MITKNIVAEWAANLITLYKTNPITGLPEGFSFLPEVTEEERARPCLVAVVSSESWPHPRMPRGTVALELMVRREDGTIEDSRTWKDLILARLPDLIQDATPAGFRFHWARNMEPQEEVRENGWVLTHTLEIAFVPS